MAVSVGWALAAYAPHKYICLMYVIYTPVWHHALPNTFSKCAR